MQYFFLLGRQPEISVIECIQVLTSLGLAPIIIDSSPLFLIVETSNQIPDDLMDRLGGTDRIAAVIGQQDTPWQTEDILKALSPTPRKFWVGMSVVQVEKNQPYDAKMVKQMIQAMKNELKKQKIFMKFVVPSTALRLNAAQVIFNKLDTPKNYELILAQGKDSWYLARTEQVQDIRAYEMRDTGKPSRDARIGMLPPKLAQIMLNLAITHLPQRTSIRHYTILDPFCGTGTILQEGWLLDQKMIGMDNNPDMIKASHHNLATLQQRFRLDEMLKPEVFEHNVRQSFPENLHNSIDAIVTEPYLGTPLKAPLSSRELENTQQELASLYRSFFKNALPLLKGKGVVLFLLPAWRQIGISEMVPFSPTLLDEISRIGYVQVQLGADRQSLIYARPDAFVGRELTLWQKS